MKLLKAFFALVIIATVTTAQNVSINATNFPDGNFRNWILQQDYGRDGMLTPSEIARITDIDVMRKGISSLTGIEYFSKLTTLDCSENQLTSIDVTKNITLDILVCSGNQLPSIDVTKNIALKYLNVSFNHLISIDVTKNVALENLNLLGNILTSIDVTKNIALESLVLGHTDITSLDVTKNIALKYLTCIYTQITSLDVTKNIALEYLDCYSNQLYWLDLSANTRLNDFSGENQKVYLAMEEGIVGYPYGTSITLEQPTNLAEGVEYNWNPCFIPGETCPGILSIESKTITKSPFTVEQGVGDDKLNGTFYFNYSSGSGTLPPPPPPPPAHTHNWSEWSDWVTAVDATCNQAGFMTRIRLCKDCGNTETETTIIPQLTNCVEKTPGYLVLDPNVVTNKANISVVISESEELAEVKIKIFDAVGNMLFTKSSAVCSPANPIIWDLRNDNGRKVSSGSYLVIAEVRTTDKADGEENSYRYTAKLGVKR